MSLKLNVEFPILLHRTTVQVTAVLGQDVCDSLFTFLKAERKAHNASAGDSQGSATDGAPDANYEADGFEAQRRANEWMKEHRLPAVGGGKGMDQSFNKT